MGVPRARQREHRRAVMAVRRIRRDLMAVRQIPKVGLAVRRIRRVLTDVPQARLAEQQDKAAMVARQEHPAQGQREASTAPQVARVDRWVEQAAPAKARKSRRH